MVVRGIADFKDRYAEALADSGISAAELSRITKISEATLSQYKSGYAKPKRDKLALIADALHVSPVWLMGMPVEKNVFHEGMTVALTEKFHIQLSEQEIKIISAYRNADEIDQRSVLRILGLVDKKNEPQLLAAHERKDVNELNIEKLRQNDIDML